MRLGSLVDLRLHLPSEMRGPVRHESAQECNRAVLRDGNAPPVGDLPGSGVVLEDNSSCTEVSVFTLSITTEAAFRARPSVYATSSISIVGRPY